MLSKISMKLVDQILLEIDESKDFDKSFHYQKFFKTGIGEYGYGDKFLGISVPIIRKLAKKYYRELRLDDIQVLIKNEYHEIRLFSLICLTYIFELADEGLKMKLYNFYLSNLQHINSWDLVDVSCYKILGEYLIGKSYSSIVLIQMANSTNLWERRSSIVSTLAFIKRGDCVLTLEIAQILKYDSHDLIHKAVGWMLREVGKQNVKLLLNFLDKNCQEMPRVMLRYSIEKFSHDDRMRYLKSCWNG